MNLRPPGPQPSQLTEWLFATSQCSTNRASGRRVEAPRGPRFALFRGSFSRNLATILQPRKCRNQPICRDFREAGCGNRTLFRHPATTGGPRDILGRSAHHSDRPERRAEEPRSRSFASDRLVTGRHQMVRIHADPCGSACAGVAVQKHWPEQGKSWFSGLFLSTGDPGVEPDAAVLETTVLPIHQSPTEPVSLMAAPSGRGRPRSGARPQSSCLPKD